MPPFLPHQHVLEQGRQAASVPGGALTRIVYLREIHLVAPDGVVIRIIRRPRRPMPRAHCVGG